jgi:tetratricopeptide (TPR) repeat protein
MPPAVFVSYSHQDERWKDRLVQQLRVLEPEGVLEVWDDRRISPGNDWLPEIEQAMGRAVAAVLLISADFLTSEFIQGQEVPRLLERRRSEGLLVLPVIVRPCDWRGVEWLAKINCWPMDGRALSTLPKAKADQYFAELVAEIRGLFKGSGKRVPPRGEETPAPHLDIGRLPTSGPLFVGRDAELARLDAAWENPGVHVLTFVAFGGVGKSTLVGRWIDSMSNIGWKGARRVFDWSFYSQGTEERVTSADRFLDSALRFFGDPDPKAGAPRDRGLRLAELVRKEKTLLVLDGVEPLQHPPGHPLAGRLKDPGLAAILKSLAGGNPGLCVVTTRERIADLESFPKTAPQVSLETLSPEAGAELLRQLEVKGKDSEMRAASAELGNHALALTLFGNYLNRAYGGDVRRRKEVDLGQADERQGGHALRVIRAYARWLGEGLELAILRQLGLFDRPAAKEALAALRARPEIPGLTELLVELSEEEWQWAVSSLREHGFLLPADPQQPGALDAHPLVRVYFQEELERERPRAWQEGNLRLYEHLKGAAPEFPETLEAMEPLYAAVVHGCRAGRHQEGLDEVYWRRIRRKQEDFSGSKLGAFGSELAALAGFFDRLWDQPSNRLSADGQAFVLNEAAFDLRALGRLAEAVPPMQAGLKRYSALEDWKAAAILASNLSELTLTLGEVGRAVAFGEQSVALADRSGAAFERLSDRAILADALHQAGRWEESAEAFREAEVMQAERQPESPRLYSLQGYRYCDLLLSRGEPEGGLDGLAASPEEARRFHQGYREVQERAVQTLEKHRGWYSLLSIALDHLSLGRAHLGRALTAPGPATPGEETEAGFAQAAEHLDHAVEGLRQSCNEDDLPRGLLARAALHRLRGNRAGAAADLSEALEIAERGGMRLHACDAHLEWARLDLQQGDAAAARKHVELARRLVNETGYKRREREVAWLEGRISGKR